VKAKAEGESKAHHGLNSDFSPTPEPDVPSTPCRPDIPARRGSGYFSLGSSL
jgi:hypothetical protein